MRWIWLDRILELETGKRCVALKCVSAAEEVVSGPHPTSGKPRAEHRQAPDPGLPAPTPVMPNTLIIEGMAQTAGILVGYTGGFKEKVILAKIAKAEFSAAATPGTAIRHSATLDRFDASGAATTGVTELIDPATGQATPLATIDLMFSHIDRNRAGFAFPEENFVFTDQFMDLLARSGFGAEGSEKRG